MQSQIHLIWTRCQSEVWCKLNAVNLAHEHFSGIEGVYVIWHGGTEPKVVYVGQGEIKERLHAHRQDSAVQRYAYLGLYVTWAAVPEPDRNGVEAYLADKWNPLVGEIHPDVDPIIVNSPWP